MAQQNFVKLASQGRAYDETRAWSEAELGALLVLESECGLARLNAALYVRNGITTKAGYEAAQKAEFVPKSLEDLRTEAIAAHQKVVLANLGLNPVEEVIEPKKVVEPEEVVSVPTAMVTESEEVAETEEVAEPEAEADPKEKKSKSKGGK